MPAQNVNLKSFGKGTNTLRQLTAVSVPEIDLIVEIQNALKTPGARSFTALALFGPSL